MKGQPYRPWITINISNPNSDSVISTYGLVDTGADECCIPADFAPLLGHDLRKGKKKDVTAGGGRTTVYAHTSSIELLGKDSKVVHKIEKVPVDFMVGLTITLLGVKKFLENFNLRVNYPKQEFSITWK